MMSRFQNTRYKTQASRPWSLVWGLWSVGQLRWAVVCVVLIGAFGLLARADVNDANKPAEAPSSQKPELLDNELRQKLMDYLEDINKWIMELDLKSGSLSNVKGVKESIFVNGNFARVLMASHKITGNKAYLDEALKWCDVFCGQQRITFTFTMEKGGFWTDFPQPRRNIYFADAGTACTALAIGCRLADKKRQARYLEAMERYALFVRQGCLTDPQGLGRKAAKSWVIREGQNQGAIGCGYYRDHLSLEPYTIATATTGGAFFSELFAITSKQEYKEVAQGATKWLLKIRDKNGEIPYLIDGFPAKRWNLPLRTITYCTEAFVAADVHLKDSEIESLLRKELKPTVQWLLAKQNPDGSWGKLKGHDQRGNPRVIMLLAWYYRQADADPEVAESVRRYCHFLLDKENSKAYGVKESARITGFVGLAVAEIVAPESTF